MPADDASGGSRQLFLSHGARRLLELPALIERYCMAHQPADIVIVGGGPGGLALAVALGQSGAPCRITILDQGGPTIRDRFGMALAPNGLLALRRLGLLSVVEKVGSRIDSVEIRAIGSSSMARFEYRRLRVDPGYSVGILPSELQVSLSTASPANVRIFYREEFLELDRDENRQTFVVTQRGGERCRYPADVVVGADGLRSKVRRYVAGDSQPRRTNEAYKVIMAGPIERLDSIRHYIAPNTMLGAVPIGKDRSFVFWLDRPDRRVGVGDEPFERFRARLLACEPSLESALQDIVGWEQVFDARVNLFHAKTWFVDNVVLLGDSLHAFTPALAQGVNTTLVDAVVLGSLLAQWIRQGQLPDELRQCLQDYYRLRHLHTYVAYYMSWLFDLALTSNIPLISSSRMTALRLLARSPAGTTFLRVISGLLPSNLGLSAADARAR